MNGRSPWRVWRLGDENSISQALQVVPADSLPGWRSKRFQHLLCTCRIRAFGPNGKFFERGFGLLLDARRERFGGACQRLRFELGQFVVDGRTLAQRERFGIA